MSLKHNFCHKNVEKYKKFAVKEKIFNLFKCNEYCNKPECTHHTALTVISFKRSLFVRKFK